jgi:hypothetical protein
MANKTSKVRGVYRRENGSPGWVVRKWNPKTGKPMYLGFYADASHGGTAKARKRAEKLSCSKGDGNRLARRIQVKRADKKSDLPVGVCWVRRKAGATATAVRAHIRVDKVLYYEDFPIGKSKDRAVAKAVKHRAQLVRETFG